MHESCSPAVLRAIEVAISRGPDGASVAFAATDLLYGLVQEEDGRATQLLARYGLDQEKIQPALCEPARERDLAIDRVLAEARAVARERDAEGTATSEYFLLALLRLAPELEQTLLRLGLDGAGLRREVLGEALPVLQMTETIRLPEASDRMDAGRVLDANANRARESLRVLDDYCRFVVNDAFLTAEFKRLRHDLAELLERLPANLLVGSRETLRDVGTGIGAAGEMERKSAHDVARVNLKRLQESLRSLEEFGKLFGPEFGEGMEQVRYRAYTLERAIVVGENARSILAETCLCVLLTGAHCVSALDWTIAEAAAGGATMFQLREKELNDQQLLSRARDVRYCTRQVGALFIVNDRPDIARLAEADGVHLGQDDLPIHEVRKIVGPDMLIGVSTHEIGHVRQAILDGASYIGVGPTFPSLTKKFSGHAGLQFVHEACAETSLPAFAIGGINGDTIASVVEAGARRVAVSAAIAKAEDPRLTARILCDALAAKKP